MVLERNKAKTIAALERLKEQAEGMPETCFGDTTVYFSWRPVGEIQLYSESFYTGNGSPKSPPPGEGPN